MLIARLIFWITFLVLIPRGQTNWHFPQSIHFAISSAMPLISPLCIRRFTLRGLKSVNLAAVQVAVQLPQPMHHLKEGSCCSTNREIEKSLFSKSICRPFNMEYPQSFTAYILLYFKLLLSVLTISSFFNLFHFSPSAMILSLLLPTLHLKEFRLQTKVLCRYRL